MFAMCVIHWGIQQCGSTSCSPDTVASLGRKGWIRQTWASPHGTCDPVSEGPAPSKSF